MKIYMATWMLETEQGRLLSKIGKRERLLSYYHIIQKISEFQRYIKTGRNR
jgi:ribosomal protein S15P/S13E